MNATSPGRAPSAPRPSSSRRRTASASKPRPAEKQKRRPLTEPSEMRRTRPSAERSADRARSCDRIARQPEGAREHARAAARQEAERHGRRRRSAPRCRCRRPRRRRSRRRSPANAAASSVAWPGRCVNSVASSIRSRSTRSTSVIRLPVTCVEYGLTIRTARFTLTSMPRTALIVAVPEAEHAVASLRVQHDGQRGARRPAHMTILFPFLDAASVDEPRSRR